MYISLLCIHHHEYEVNIYCGVVINRPFDGGWITFIRARLSYSEIEEGITLGVMQCVDHIFTWHNLLFPYMDIFVFLNIFMFIFSYLFVKLCYGAYNLPPLQREFCVHAPWNLIICISYFLFLFSSLLISYFVCMHLVILSSAFLMNLT